MPLNKVFQKIRAKGAATFESTADFVGSVTHQSGVTLQSSLTSQDDQKIFLGTDGDFSLRFDSAAGEAILRDENNSTDIARFQANTALNALLENGGVHELNVAGLSGDLADAQDPKNHASSHGENSADEILVENIGAASTNTDLVFKPDGSGGVQAASGAAGGATTILDTASLSGASEWITDAVDLSNYRVNKVIWSGLVNTVGETLDIHVRNSGANLTTSDYDYVEETIDTSGSTTIGNTSSSRAYIGTSNGNQLWGSTGRGVEGELSFGRGWSDAGSFNRFRWTGSAGFSAFVDGMADYEVEQVVDGIRLFADSGSLTGDFALLGVA